MPSLVIVCDPRDASGAELSAALRDRAPADFAVMVAPPDDASLAAVVGDAVLLASDVDAPRVIARLRDGGYGGPVLAVWPHSWPRDLQRFHAAYRAADAVILNDSTYWDRLGRLPRAHFLGLAVDHEAFADGPPAGERPLRILLARDPQRRSEIGFDRWLDEEALWFLRDLGIPVSSPGDVTRTGDLRDWLRTGSVVVCWDDDVDSRRVLLAAHGNSLRALVKYLDDVSEADIVGLNIPTAIPLVYELDDALKPQRHYYLGDPSMVEAAVRAVANQGKARV